MTNEERTLLLTVAMIVLARHTNSGPDANAERGALRLAIAPFRSEIEANLKSWKP